MTMRFYTLLLTILFILNSQLNAHTFQIDILTSEQIAQINAEGIKGAQAVIADLDASELLSDSETVKGLVAEIADLLAAIDSSDAAIFNIAQAVSESVLLLSNDVSIDLNADGASDSTDISLLIGAISEGISIGSLHGFIESSGDVNGDGKIDAKDVSSEITDNAREGLKQGILAVAPNLKISAPDTLLNFAAEQAFKKGQKDIEDHLRKKHNEFPERPEYPRVETLNEDPTIVSPTG